MQRYIRFQTNLKCQRFPGSLGIFYAAHEFVRIKSHPDYVYQTLETSFDWFNENLIVPRLRERHWRAVFWFRSESYQFVTSIWPIVVLLNELGVHVHKVRSDTPGRIIYADAHQIAAIPGRYIPRRYSARFRKRLASVPDRTAGFEPARRGSIPRRGTDRA